VAHRSRKDGEGKGLDRVIRVDEAEGKAKQVYASSSE